MQELLAGIAIMIVVFIGFYLLFRESDTDREWLEEIKQEDENVK